MIRRISRSLWRRPLAGTVAASPVVPAGPSAIALYSLSPVPIGLFPPQLTGEAESIVLSQTILFSFSMR